MELGEEEDAYTWMLLLEENMGGAGDVPRGRAPRRNVRRADDHDDADDDDNGERELRSGAAGAARPRVEWTGAGGRKLRDQGGFQETWG